MVRGAPAAYRSLAGISKASSLIAEGELFNLGSVPQPRSLNVEQHHRTMARQIRAQRLQHRRPRARRYDRVGRRAQCAGPEAHEIDARRRPLPLLSQFMLGHRRRRNCRGGARGVPGAGRRLEQVRGRRPEIRLEARAPRVADGAEGRRAAVWNGAAAAAAAECLARRASALRHHHRRQRGRLVVLWLTWRMPHAS